MAGWTTHLRRTVLGLGLALVATAAQAVTLIRDADIEHQLSELVRPLVRAAGLSPSRIKVLLIEDPSMNAFVIDSGHIFINREDPEQAIATLNEARNRLVDGTSVLFFPEGTRSRNGQLKPFKKGAFKMAQDLQLPVLPITITGTRDILPAGSLSLHPGTVSVTIHNALPVTGHSTAELQTLVTQSHALIAAPLSSGCPEPLL